MTLLKHSAYISILYCNCHRFAEAVAEAEPHKLWNTLAQMANTNRTNKQSDRLHQILSIKLTKFMTQNRYFESVIN